MESASYEQVLNRTERDFTTHWSCRKGDILLWFRRGPFAGENASAKVIDLCSMPDSAFIIITNRWQDFPDWFDLHPLEVKDSLATWMMKRINGGEVYPEEPLEGPNIWRAKGGDRIVWAGPPRPGRASVNGILGLLDCREAVAVLMEHPDGPLAFMDFNETSDSKIMCRAGADAEHSLGPIRQFAEDWKLG